MVVLEAVMKLRVKRLSRGVFGCIVFAWFAATCWASPIYFQGFEDSGWDPTDSSSDDWHDTDRGKIRRVTSGNGVNGVSSSAGGAHAEVYDLTDDYPVFTRYGGYSSSFGNGFSAAIDFYLDPTWSDGQGFDFGTAINRQTGDHLRDFIWHVGMVDGDLLVNASNNFNGFYESHLVSGNPYTVSAAGWYTFESVYREDEGTGNLNVDFNLLESSGSLVYSSTLASGDDVATTVGGHRYGYLMYTTVGDLALDNSVLEYTSVIPEPSTMLLFGLGTLVLAGMRRRKD